MGTSVAEKDGDTAVTAVETLVSVIVPVHNGEEFLAACLSAVLGSDLPAFEVIVVDDGSRDGSEAVARGFPCRVVALCENRGPAAARNKGAEAARSPILFFLDADVLVTPRTLRDVADTLRDKPDVSALFCSYQKDTAPRNFFSRYKNLVHHHTHQTAREDAATFCGGFGAIRREVFLQAGGFDEGYRVLEDIELGYRLHRAGHRIFLNKAIQLTHLKEYSFSGLVRSDLFGRAVPWTRLMLGKRVVRNDLNTRVHNVLSVPVSFALLAALPAAALFPPCGAGAAVLLAAALILLNGSFLRLVLRERGVSFTLKTVGMLWVTYLYSGLGLVLGVLAHLRDRTRRAEDGRS